MKTHRLRIAWVMVAVAWVMVAVAWVMVAVAIVALDLGAIRAMLVPRPGPVVHFLVLGALPMANVLVVGLLIAQQRPRGRPFLLGFETFGAIALTLFIALVVFLPDYHLTMLKYQNIGINILEKIIGWDQPFFIPVAYFVAMGMLGWPQVAFALVGGFLSHRFKITSTPR